MIYHPIINNITEIKTNCINVGRLLAVCFLLEVCVVVTSSEKLGQGRLGPLLTHAQWRDLGRS